MPYRQFYEEVLSETTEPFEMQNNFQEKYAHDPFLIDCYRDKFAYHGFHPFTGVVLGNLRIEIPLQGYPRWAKG